MSEFNTELGYVFSTLNHSVFIKYGRDTINLPPRGKSDNVDRFKLGSLPKGVYFEPYNKGK